MKITSCATSSILEIVRLCYEDVGTYACFITNSGGSNSAHMTLNIHGEFCHMDLCCLQRCNVVRWGTLHSHYAHIYVIHKLQMLYMSMKVT